MPKFDAGSFAEDLEYDFTKAGVPGAAGTIPEPTDKQIGQWLTDVQAAATKLRTAAGITEIDPDNPVALLAAMEAINADQFVAVLDDLSKAAAALCGGKPSVTQIRRLPLRVRQHFFAYLQTEVVNPEAGPGGGNVVALTAPSRAAG